MIRSIRRPLIEKRHTLGHTVIDAEHAAVADCWLRVVNSAPLQFPLNLARLKKLLARHFDHESALMAANGGRLCQQHRREHRALLDLCEEALALHQRDWRKTQSLLRNTFPVLLREHIASMDQCAVLFLNSNIRNVCM